MREQAPWERYYCRCCKAEVPADKDFCDTCAANTAARCLKCGGPTGDAAAKLCATCAAGARIVTGPNGEDVVENVYRAQTCPHCRRHLKLDPPQPAGTTLQCGLCFNQFVVGTVPPQQEGSAIGVAVAFPIDLG